MKVTIRRTYQYSHIVMSLRSLTAGCRALVITLCMTALILGAAARPTTTDTADQSSLTSAAHSLKERTGIPGLAVAVIDKDRVSTATVGTDANGHRVTTSTPFLLGSVSKSLTSAAVYALTERGTLSLDDDVATAAERNDLSPGLASITVRQLLNHTSGLSTHAGLEHADQFLTGTDAIERALGDLPSLTPSEPVGRYAYSDLNYLLLGYIVERASGQPFTHAVQDLVLSPAGLENVALDHKEAARLELGAGHRRWFGMWRAFDRGYDDSGAPYGYAATTVDGAVAYANAWLPGGKLPETTRTEATRGVVSSGDDQYGAGWRVGTYEGERLVHHTGATPGYFAHVWLLPDSDRAVVVLANGYSEALAPTLASAAPAMLQAADGDPDAIDEVPGGDPALSAAPWALAVIALIGLAAATLACARPGRRWVALGIAIAVTAALAFLPLLVGYTWQLLLLWAPDVAWAGITATGACALTVIALLVGVFRARGTPRS